MRQDNVTVEIYYVTILLKVCICNSENISIYSTAYRVSYINKYAHLFTILYGICTAAPYKQQNIGF